MSEFHDSHPGAGLPAASPRRTRQVPRGLASFRAAWGPLAALALVAAAGGMQPARPQQDTPPAVQEAPPPRLAELEVARSRQCVAAVARMEELDQSLEPYAKRMDRLMALGQAVSLERADDVRPFAQGDTLEEAVARWFEADSTLAARILATRDSALVRERAEARESILARLRQAVEEVAAQGRALAEAGAPVEEAFRPCDGAVFIRSAVLEACSEPGVTSPLCDAAKAESSQGPFRFVETPQDLWDVEEYRPWSQAGPLQPGPEGSLVGARTTAVARRGNLAVAVSFAPMLERRSDLTPEAVANFQARLDSLGFSFDHPLFVMAPALEFQANLPGILGGETHYVLHFGDLGQKDDMIWAMEAGPTGRVQTAIPATARVLERLAAGEGISFSAIKVPEGGSGQAEAVFSLPLLEVGQTTNVTPLLEYMKSGGLARDLKALVPVGTGEVS